MAQGIGEKPIAAFVENDDIVRVLVAIGVDLAPHYHIGHPALTIQYGATPTQRRAQGLDAGDETHRPRSIRRIGKKRCGSHDRLTQRQTAIVSRNPTVRQNLEAVCAQTI